MTRRVLPPMLAVATLLTTGCVAKDQLPAPPAINNVAITALDYAFEAPDTIPAGMTAISMLNKGPGFHHVQLVKLDSGKTPKDFADAMKDPTKPPPAWAMFVPGPNPVDPGGTANETIDLAAGNYAIICLVDVPEHKPHFALGMIRPLVVTPSAGPTAAAPTADVSIALSDYAFTISTPLTAGRHMIEVTNSGPQPHELFVLKLTAGKTLDDFGKWMAKPEGPPPGAAMGGISVAMPGAKAWFSVDLTAGDYVLICFVPDGKDGKPHIEHGMVQTFKIG